MNCRGTNASGEPCGITIGIDEDGLCAAHREGGQDRLRAQASAAGKASTARYATEGLRDNEARKIRNLRSVADVKKAVGVVLSALAERRIVPQESKAFKEQFDVWLKGDASQQTELLLTEVQKQLARAKHECAQATAERDRAMQETTKLRQELEQLRKQGVRAA